MNKLIAIGLLFVGGAAHAFSAPFPNKTQQKQLAAKLTSNAQRTNWYKDAAKGGYAPKINVTFAYSKTPRGFIGSGFPHATVTAITGGHFEERNYTVTEGLKGKFTARADSKWASHPLYRALGSKNQ